MVHGDDSYRPAETARSHQHKYALPYAGDKGRFDVHFGGLGIGARSLNNDGKLATFAF